MKELFFEGRQQSSERPATILIPNPKMADSVGPIKMLPIIKDDFLVIYLFEILIFKSRFVCFRIL